MVSSCGGVAAASPGLGVHAASWVCCLAAAFDPSQEEEGGPAAGADVLQQMRAALECDVCHDTIKVRHSLAWSLCLGRYRAGLLTVAPGACRRR